MNGSLSPIQFDFTMEDIPWSAGKALFSLWQQHKKKRLWPQKSDLRPTDMKTYLPDILLVDMITEQGSGTSQPDFIIRLAGTGFRELVTRDLTGMRIADLPGGHVIVERFRTAIKRQSAYISLDLPLFWSLFPHRAFDLLVLPLGGESVQHLIIHVNHHKRKTALK